jgi:hypothetical protein
VDILKEMSVNQKAMNSICHLRIVDRIHLRLKDGDGGVLVDAPDGCSEEGEDPLRGVLLLRAVAEDEDPRNQRHWVNRVVCHGCEHCSVLLDGGRGELCRGRGR